MAGIGGTYTLRVDPKDLLMKAKELETLTNNMELKFNSIADIINKTAHYWIGQAGEAHRKRYVEKKEIIAEMLKKLKEHSKDLILISGNYSEGEKVNLGTAEILPEDILV